MWDARDTRREVGVRLAGWRPVLPKRQLQPVYATCIYCHASLGANEAIEHFPIGRRLAFDAGRGRLWVVCRSCTRWNLTPIEDRWEAIEECERAFRGTTLRYSTTNIGLARLGEGTDLVRVGEVLRPEFAAWRYGDQFGRRRRRYLAAGAAGLGISLTPYAVALAGPVVIVPYVLGILYGGYRATKEVRRDRQVVARVQSRDGIEVDILRSELASFKLVRGEEERWAIQIQSAAARILIVDDAAVRVGSLAVAEANMAGASRTKVADAVSVLESLKSPEELRRVVSHYDRLVHMPPERRLALEMALNEDAERKVLEGELAELELAWKQAEELAAISDNLLLPESVTEWMARRRQS